MPTSNLQDLLFRLTLQSLRRSLADLSQECDLIKKTGIESVQQVHSLVAQHEHLMNIVCKTLIRFMSENPSLSASLNDHLCMAEVKNLLDGSGVCLADES